MPEELKRGFGYWTVLALAVGSIFGTTLFFGAPLGAKHSGNLLLVAWVILAVIAVYIAAIFGELTALFPKAGGAYEFSKQAYGKFISFMIAWVAWMFGSISTVVIIIAAVNSLGVTNGFQGFILSVGLILILNMVAYLGVDASKFMLILLGLVIIAIPIVIIVKGLGTINAGNFQPFFTHDISTILVALFFMGEAFFGWEAVTYLAEETRNPTKVIPKALILATIIIGILGFLLLVVTLGVARGS